MSQSIVRKLVLKDLYLCRWLIGGALVTGAIALAMMPLGQVAFYVGCVSFMGVIIVLNVMIVMVCVVGERKEKVAHFMLSLHVSTTQYIAAKIVANCAAFFIPFAALLAVSVLVIKVTSIPDGFIPLTLAVLGYVIFYFSMLLTAAILAESTGWATSVIVFGNISINFVITGLLHDPLVSSTSSGPTVVWTTPVVVTLVLEIASSLIVLALCWYFSTRKKNFI